jgi:hypothetical protein
MRTGAETVRDTMRRIETWFLPRWLLHVFGVDVDVTVRQGVNLQRGRAPAAALGSSGFENAHVSIGQWPK